MIQSPPVSSAVQRTMRFRDWSSLRYHLIWAYEGPVTPSALTGHYTDQETSCWLIRKGSVKLTTDGRSVTAKAGQWVFVAVPSRSQSFSRDAEILSLHFHMSWPGGEPLYERRQSTVFPAERFPRLEQAARPIVKLARKHFPQANTFLPEVPTTFELYLRVQSLLPAWLVDYIRAQHELGFLPRRLAGVDERVLVSAMELDHLPLQRRLVEAEIAQNVGLSRSHLNALFVEALGTTPRRYFEKRKLESARQLLGQTTTSIKEIAFGLGFNYESHFCAWFRRLEGMRPSQFRQQRRLGA